IDAEARLAPCFQSLSFVTAQRLQRSYPAFVSCPSGFDPLANPCLLFGEFLVEFGECSFFDFEQLLFLAQIRIEIAGKRRQLATIQLDEAGREATHKSAVMGDKDQRSLIREQIAFEPCNGVDIKM